MDLVCLYDAAVKVTTLYRLRMAGDVVKMKPILKMDGEINMFVSNHKILVLDDQVFLYEHATDKIKFIQAIDSSPKFVSSCILNEGLLIYGEGGHSKFSVFTFDPQNFRYYRYSRPVLKSKLVRSKTDQV